MAADYSKECELKVTLESLDTAEANSNPQLCGGATTHPDNATQIQDCHNLTHMVMKLVSEPITSTCQHINTNTHQNVNTSTPQHLNTHGKILLLQTSFRHIVLVKLLCCKVQCLLEQEQEPISIVATIAPNNDRLYMIEPYKTMFIAQCFHSLVKPNNSRLYYNCNENSPQYLHSHVSVHHSHVPVRRP